MCIFDLLVVYFVSVFCIRKNCQIGALNLIWRYRMQYVCMRRSLLFLHQSLSADDEIWLQVYAQAIGLNTTMLSTLRYNYLQEALNFVGCHQQRLAQVSSVMSPHGISRFTADCCKISAN